VCSVYYETEDRPKVLNGEYLDDQLDSLEEVQSRAIDHLPLWYVMLVHLYSELRVMQGNNSM
jgi:hypothetical protein